MNAQIFDNDTGEILARTVTRFMTRYDYKPPVGEFHEGESETDTSLYQPLKEVVERCERAGMLRQLLDGANSMRFDSDKPVSDEVLDSVDFYTGDVFTDVNIGTEAFVSDYEASLEKLGTHVADVSEEAVQEPAEAVSDDGDENK